MLVFFIHGVATRDVRYADGLQTLIRQEFARRNEQLPHFYSGFWGDVLNDLEKVWNWIYQDLQVFKAEDSAINSEDIFRYQNLRKGFLSEFVGDALTYFNSDRGAKIRELISTQLEDFINRHPEETELHIVAHSLGTIILWDLLFSDKLDRDPATLKIRSRIRGLDSADQTQRICLKSITTMGSPILLFNLMMAIAPDKVKLFSDKHQHPLKWTNVIHASDIIAYPVCSSLGDRASWKLLMKDEFIRTKANGMEEALLKLINSSAIQALGSAYVDALLYAPMITGAADAHTGYWNCQKTTRLILENILGAIAAKTYLREAIALLCEVSGMTKHLIQIEQPRDEMQLEVAFQDGSGVLKLYVNRINIHHVFVLDSNGSRQFSGFVGWIHTNGLKATIAFIQSNFC